MRITLILKIKESIQLSHMQYFSKSYKPTGLHSLSAIKNKMLCHGHMMTHNSVVAVLQPVGRKKFHRIASHNAPITDSSEHNNNILVRL